MEGNKTGYTPEALAQLSREELRRILAAELVKAAPEIDDDFVRLLLTESQKRGDDPTFTDDDAVEVACKKFQQDTETAQKPQKHWYQSWMVSAASVVLLLGILFFTLPGAAQADDLPEVLGWWSDSVFQFIRPGQKPNIEEYVYETGHPGLKQIYDAVSELGITSPTVPRWVPDGFELVELKKYQIAEVHSIYANFENNSTNILITVTNRDTKIALQHEKDESVVSIWDLGNVEHYVMSNESEWIITWVSEEYECIISADCAKEDVYRIIKSIYTSED